MSRLKGLPPLREFTFSTALRLRGELIRLALVLAIGLLCGCAVQEGDAAAEPADKSAHKFTNRLARETSPYLLLHAHNPVDWYPWGPEALEKARKEDKCIFLSIGYSSCYWCHVMERKVFSDPEIARYMNEHFVNIKIDREERPDLDDVYMTALQVYYQALGVNSAGGWPLSLFLTPDGKPLGGGTYFPPRDEEGRMGFSTLMARVFQGWTDQRKDMQGNAEYLTQAVQATMKPRVSLTPVKLETALITQLVEKLQASYDPEHGGFGFNPAAPQRPKFPVPVKLALLQYAAKKQSDQKSGQMLYHTLDRMAAGGIYDHLGGGFHRYSTDRQWHVPHFEKMLYDNAQLADVYAEAFRQTGTARYKQVAEETIAFVLRELTDPMTGGFYSALDAETDGIEGKYYVWSRAEISATLSPDEAKLISAVYGLNSEQNFEHGYVLQLARPVAEIAAEMKLTPSQLEARLTSARQKLLAARQKRQPLLRDDKVLTSWNGLMIRSLARAGTNLEKPQYVEASAKAATFLLANLRDERGRLLRTWRGGTAKLNAYLDDYAFLIEGLIALHDATRDDKWLNAARRLTDLQLELFWDAEQKGSYFTSHDHEAILARTKNAYDAVLPSGNSVAARNFIRLASLSKQASYRERAKETLDVFASAMQENPGGLTNMALALGEFLESPDLSAVRGILVPDETPSAIVLTGGTKPASRRSIPLDNPSQSVIEQAAASTPATLPPETAFAQADKKKSEDKPAAKKSPDLVTGEVFLSVDRLPPGSTCKVLVRLTIAEGWHINTNPAMPDYLEATLLTVAAKQGTKLKSVSYPRGEIIPQPGNESPLHVYARRAEIIGTLEIPAAAAGSKEELSFQVKYQPCNDDQCLPPKTLTLKVPIAVAAKGEAVKSINAKLFEPPAKKK